VDNSYLYYNDSLHNHVKRIVVDLRPDFLLHEYFDGTHPNLRGTCLAACVVYLSLYKGTLDGLSYDYFGDLSAADIEYLQTVATIASERFSRR
jgi:hypothetical protein